MNLQGTGSLHTLLLHHNPLLLYQSYLLYLLYRTKSSYHQPTNPPPLNVPPTNLPLINLLLSNPPPPNPPPHKDHQLSHHKHQSAKIHCQVSHHQLSPLTQPLIIQAGKAQLTIRLDEDREKSEEEDPEDPRDPEDPAHREESSSSSSSDSPQQKEKETEHPHRKATSSEARNATLGMYYTLFSL